MMKTEDITSIDDLFDFPCKFPVKAMGEATEHFEFTVVEIVRKHAPDLGEAAVVCRASSNGKFLAVTCTVNAKSREQLDAIYLDLTGHPAVKVAL